MITNGDGVAWLEALAEHYEQTAREIRAVARSIKHETEARLQGESMSQDAVSVTEAIRRVLSEARGAPLRPHEIERRIRSWNLKTRSRNLTSSVGATLHGLKQSGFALQTPDGWIAEIYYSEGA